MTTTTNVLPLPEGVEKLPSGNFRFRLEHRGKVLRGTYGTPEEAAEVRAETKRAIALGHVELVEHGSIAEIGPAFLKSREGNRGYATESRRWNLHIAKSSLGRRAARSISRRDVLRWLDELRAKMTSYDPKIHGRREPKPLAW